MDQESLRQCFNQLSEGIKVCIEKDLTTPSLILIYSAIDIAGWLNSENPGEPVKNRFISWVERYLLPAKELKCSAIELYGARCGLVHSLSPESDVSKKGAARKIIYSSRTNKPDELQEMIMLAKISDYIPVKVEDLFEAYCQGLDVFLKELLADPSKAANVYDKATSIFITLTDQERKDLIQWGKTLLGQS